MVNKKYYVYKITNLTNGKVYIGKRTHVNPEKDTYMGSGKLILAAIKKYGRQNFSKEILAVFDTENEAAILEKSLVTKEFIYEGNTYNLHEGGFGGFSHINSLPKSERPNLIKISEMVKRGTYIGGGTSNWTEKSWKRVRDYSFKNQIEMGTIKANTWENLSEEEYSLRKQKISEASKGIKNSQKDTHVYINEDFPLEKKLPPASELNKHRYKPGEQPKGWIPIGQWKDNRKNKSSPCYGKHWYNDGIKNYYYLPDDIRIIELKLSLGRLKCTFGRIHEETRKTEDAKDIGDAGGSTSPDPPVMTVGSTVISNGSDIDSI